MHASKVLHKLFRQSAPSIHLSRLKVIICAVDSLCNGAHARVTSLGRRLHGEAFQKHKIKRADRLLSNQHLFNDRVKIYSAMTNRLLEDISSPIIAIDWSPLCADQSQQLLRAALPVGGRTLTLFEEIHPQSKLGNREVQQRFLNRLLTMVPPHCRPIIVADSGFKTPFYRHIEQKFGWHWLGRIRGQDKVLVAGCKNAL